MLKQWRWKMDYILLISIIMELAIAGLALMIATKKKKVYGYALALTFGIYVLYDSARLLSLTIAPMLLTGIFFLATCSALYAMVRLYKE